MSDDATPPAAPPPAPPAPPAPPPAPAWHGIPETDTEALAFVKTKGWNGPGDVIKSYREAEKFIGRDPASLVSIPKADDPAGFRAVLQKLGLPESPDKYEFATTEGVTPDGAYLDWAKNTFHKVGLLPNQVKQLTAEHNAFVKATIEKQDADYNLKVSGEKQALQTEWGGGYERMHAAAKAAANSLGFTGPMIDAMERSIGYAGTMKFFADLGKKMGEDGFVAGGTPKFTGMMTPAEAKSQWEASKFDKEFQKALNDNQHPGHKAAVEKQTTLFRIMYPS